MPSRCSWRTWRRRASSTSASSACRSTTRTHDSTVFNFGNVVINLLAVSQAPELIAPAAVAGPEAGSRMQFSIEVEDVDAMAADLQSRGVQLLNGPMDRPWGIRTAAFADPAGHIWEIVA